MSTHGRSGARPQGDDRGSTLVLVLLLVVVAGLVVVPLMQYATSVLRLNTAVSERTKDIEAAKSGLRVALDDPFNVFTTCDGGGSLESVDLNGTTVITTCAEISEFGPIDALGFEVPVGAVAAQLGAEVPAIAVGDTMQSDPVPPYPTTVDWWAAHLPDPLLGYELWDAADGAIWMPGLPDRPSESRAATPYDALSTFTTGSGIECKVFFPGRYDQPLVLGNDGASGNPVYYYFASGVYYFEQSITVHEDADVVVGLGLEDFTDRAESEQSECANDLQIVNGVVVGPTVPAIDGFGATWVLGDDARLIVDDSAGSPSLRFNQRYAEEDKGGRISIMTVNGVANGSTVDPHDVPMVNLIPPSVELDTIDTDNDISVASSIDATEYVPSDVVFTDAARIPFAPTLTVVGHKHRRLSDGSDRGAVLATWDEMVDNAAGGALIDAFEIEMRRTSGGGSPTPWLPVCLGLGDIVHLAGTGPGGIDQHACYIAEAQLGREYEVRVRAVNVAGRGPFATAGDRTPGSGGNDAVPDAPTGVMLDETDVDDMARISWTPSISPDDVTITGYTATLERIVGAAAHPDLPPRMFLLSPAYLELVGSAPIGYRIATVDPNGGATTLSLDLTDVPADWTVAATSQIDLLITPPASGAPGVSDPGEFFDVDYTVTDATGNAESKTLTIGWVGAYSSGADPTPDAKTFDAYVDATPTVFELPFTHQRGEAISVTSDDIALLPAGWAATRVGNAITVSTSLTDGSTATLNYVVTDVDGDTDSAPITLIAPTSTSTLVPAGSCTVAASPWFDTAQSCEITDVTDLDTGAGETGFVATVVANSSIGDSATSPTSAVRGANFDGRGTAASAPPERIVDAWTPEPIIDIRADSGSATRVRIAGYVAIPMGRIRVDNPSGDTNDTIEIVGGVVAGTYDIVDPADTDTVIGFLNDIVLQRQIRITSTADTATSVAVVQVNEDGDYAINSWVID